MLIATAEIAAMAATPPGFVVDVIYRLQDRGTEYVLRFRPVGVQAKPGEWPELSSWTTSPGQIEMADADFPTHLSAAISAAEEQNNNA